MTAYLRLILTAFFGLSLVAIVPTAYAATDDLDELQGKLGNEWVIVKNDQRRNIKTWAKQEDEWSHNLIALGDFNIDRQGDPLWKAFTSTGLRSPEALDGVPRTIFADTSRPESGKFYDQIAWFHDGKGRPLLSMAYRSAGFVDFLPYVYREQNLSKQAISYRISDHFPLWAEFALK